MSTEECIFMGKELRESRLLPSSGRGRVFTQFLTHKFKNLSMYITYQGHLPNSSVCLTFHSIQSTATVHAQYKGPLMGPLHPRHLYLMCALLANAFLSWSPDGVGFTSNIVGCESYRIEWQTTRIHHAPGSTAMPLQSNHAYIH